jgi:hypothetical protein
MSVLAALTPPFLMGAVVIAAIVAFLRYEMGRKRQDGATGSADDYGQAATSAAQDSDGAGSDADAAAAGSGDR